MNAHTDSARKELAPDGVLRIGVAVSPSPSAIFVVRDASGGSLRGVTIDLGRALGESLGVPVRFIEYASSGAITAAADKGEWDASFMPVDAERKKVMDFGAPYHLLQSTYLVRAGSKVESLEAANQPGVRIVGIEGTATFRASNKASPNALQNGVKTPDEAIALLKAGEADALAMGRESLMGLLGLLPGARVLEGGFMNSTTAVVVPKGKPAALAYVTDFIEQAKASDLVRRAFDAIGLNTSVVAPAGMKP
jgi:polar amino acid transport system substrate-binding protein